MASKGYGSTLGYGATPTPVAKVRDASLGGIEWDVIDVSNQDSADGFREKISGLADAGEFEFDVIYSKAGAAALYAKGGVQDDWTWELTDGSTLEFTGFISSFGMEVPFEEEISNSLTITITGKPVFTAAA
jgi:hypothetical protein